MHVDSDSDSGDDNVSVKDVPVLPIGAEPNPGSEGDDKTNNIFRTIVNEYIKKVCEEPVVKRACLLRTPCMRFKIVTHTQQTFHASVPGLKKIAQQEDKDLDIEEARSLVHQAVLSIMDKLTKRTEED